MYIDVLESEVGDPRAMAKAVTDAEQSAMWGVKGVTAVERPMSRLAEWFAIFRAGTHTDRNGRSATFSATDLDGIVEGYEAGSSSCVITHDELYSPFGFGRVAELKRDGDVLYARCDADSIEPQFAGLVEAGRLHNRSCQLVPLDAGGYRLGHVAFLGAEPPAVDGLPPIQMAATVLTFGSDDAWDKVWEADNRASLWEALRRLARRLLSAEEADELVPEWQANSAREDVGAAREARTTGGRHERGPQQPTAPPTSRRRDAPAPTRRAPRPRRLCARRRRRPNSRPALRGSSTTGSSRPSRPRASSSSGSGSTTGSPSRFEASGRTAKVAPREHLFTMLESLPAQVSTRAVARCRHRPRHRPPISTMPTPSGPPRSSTRPPSRRAGRFVTDLDAVRHVTARSQT